MVIEGCNNMCAPVPGYRNRGDALPSSPLQKFEDESEKTKTAQRLPKNPPNFFSSHLRFDLENFIFD